MSSLFITHHQFSLNQLSNPCDNLLNKLERFRTKTRPRILDELSELILTWTKKSLVFFEIFTDQQGIDDVLISSRAKLLESNSNHLKSIFSTNEENSSLNDVIQWIRLEKALTYSSGWIILIDVFVVFGHLWSKGSHR